MSALPAVPAWAEPAKGDLRAAPARRLGEWIIPRGREASARALIGAMRFGAAADGFEVGSVRLEFDRVALVLRRASPPAEHVVELVHGSAAEPGDARAGALAIRAKPGTPAVLIAAARAGIERHGAGELPWVHAPGAAGTKTGEGRLERSPPFPWWAFGATVGGGLALAFAASALTSWRRRAAEEKRKAA